MTAELIDRKGIKAEVRRSLPAAQVSAKAMTALYLGLLMALELVDLLAGGGVQVVERNALGIFVYVLTVLLSSVLGAGFILYCMAVRRGERAEFLTLFDGFTFVGKIVLLELVTALFVMLWSMLLVIPGIVALYRYRFAPYDLYEDPSMGVMEALRRSKRQTLGYKGQLFVLDWSYFGWHLLASLPVIVESALLSWQAIALMTGDMAQAASLPALSGPAALAWTLLSGLWMLAVGLFYIPDQQCVDLAYYETAKRTSGVGTEPFAPEGEW